jgi:hypothetical protein
MMDWVRVRARAAAEEKSWEADAYGESIAESICARGELG